MMNNNNIILPPPPYIQQQPQMVQSQQPMMAVHNPNASFQPVLQASSAQMLPPTPTVQQMAYQQPQRAVPTNIQQHVDAVVTGNPSASSAGANDASQQAPSITHSERSSLLDNVMHTVSQAENSAMDFTTASTLEHKWPRAFFRITLITVLLALITFIVWVLVSGYDYPWFIHPFHVFGMIIAACYVAGSKAILSKRLFALHVTWVTLTCIMFVFANLSIMRYPWFIYPCSVFIFAFCVHALYHKFYSFFNAFSIHVILFFIGNIVIFLAYAYGSERFPWNLIVHCAWAAILIVHLILHKLLWPKIQGQVASSFDAMKNLTSFGPTITTTALNATTTGPSKDSFGIDVEPPAPYVMPTTSAQTIIVSQPPQTAIVQQVYPTVYPSQ